jgi:hypothetical protein
MTLLFGLSLLLLASCREEKKGTVVATVGTAVLTREEALGNIDTAGGQAANALNAYIDAWVNNELVYQEALREKVDQSEEVRRQVTDAERHIVNQQFLDRFLKKDSAKIGEEELRAYYDAHQSEVLAPEMLVQLHVAVFGSRERASSFTAAALKAPGWDGALADTALSADLVRSVPLQYYSQRTLYPAELWKIAATLALNDISYPVKLSSGYAVLQLTGVVRQGKPLPFELAREDLSTRLLIERRKKMYGELLGTLRKRYAVKLFTRAPGQPDTVRYETHE